MGLDGRQSLLLIPLWLLVTCVHPRAGLEKPLCSPALQSHSGRKAHAVYFHAGAAQGRFDNLSISDADPIWLVVAHSNATQNFAAPQKVDAKYAPATFTQNGYYLTLRANRVHYQGGRPSSQLLVLRVGNDTSCSMKSVGCNSPLPGSGPFKVKFLVMDAKGPVADTEWSEEICLQQAQTFRAVLGSQSEGTVVIIAFLSILLGVLLASFLVLAVSTGCRSTSASRSGEQVHMRRYHTHHIGSSPAVRGIQEAPGI